jgi:hypothetical protein
MCSLRHTVAVRTMLDYTYFLPVLLLAATAGAVARAQPASDSAELQAPAVAPPAESRYWLRVTAEHVNLRSRADLNSRIVGRVNRDDVLAGRGAENGWHRIVPPADVFSLVAAQYIERVGDDRGRVQVDTSLRVRVGSDLQPRDPLLSEVQTHLERGAEVRILGELDGGWLKIIPPDDVYVYVSTEYVEQITPEAAARLRAAKAAAQAVDSAEPVEPATQPAEQPELSGPWGQRLSPLLERIEAEEKKPVDQQAWDAIKAELQPIADQREEPQVAQLAASWLDTTNRRVEQQAVARGAAEITHRSEEDLARPGREREDIRRAKVEKEQRPRFDARGVLRPSFAVPPGPYGLRYKLQDPFTHEVAAYVEFPTELGFDIPACIGKYVGVRGEKQTVEGVKVSILRVTHLTVLNPDKPIPPPPREQP